MRIGKMDQALTAISESDAHSITVRGSDLCDDLIGKIGFTEYFWLLVTGARPSTKQRAMMDACLVAIAEHGLVPSVQAARMTLAAAPEAWQGAMAAGILGMGTVVAGSSEVAGQFLAAIAADADATGTGDAQAVRKSLAASKAARTKVPGLGHGQHQGGDPRADRLLAIADELGVSGRHVGILRAMGEQAPKVMNRPLPVNVSGAIPAVILDAGWPLDALKAVPILARTAGLAAHLLEESRRSIGFILSFHADNAISYDGASAAKG